MKLPVIYKDIPEDERYLVREAYIELQKGRCCYCEERLDRDPMKKVMETWVDTGLFPKGFFDHPIHLHHDHKTGLTIGAVHSRCNAVLWQYDGE